MQTLNQIATAVLIAAFSTQTASTEASSNAGQMKRSAFGCQSRDEYYEIARLSDDKEAFTKALLAKLGSGRCMLLETGQQVYLVESSLFSGMVRVRPKGDPTNFWTNSEGVTWSWLAR